MTKRESGFSVVEFVLVLVFLAGIVGVGYWVMHRNDNKQPAAVTSNSSTPTAPTVQKTSDLDSASQTLDQTNVDAATSDSSQLDSLANGF